MALAIALYIIGALAEAAGILLVVWQLKLARKDREISWHYVRDDGLTFRQGRSLRLQKIGVGLLLSGVLIQLAGNILGLYT